MLRPLRPRPQHDRRLARLRPRSILLDVRSNTCFTTRCMHLKHPVRVKAGRRQCLWAARASSRPKLAALSGSLRSWAQGLRLKLSFRTLSSARRSRPSAIALSRWRFFSNAGLIATRSAGSVDATPGSQPFMPEVKTPWSCLSLRRQHSAARVLRQAFWLQVFGFAVRFERRIAARGRLPDAVRPTYGLQSVSRWKSVFRKTHRRVTMAFAMAGRAGYSSRLEHPSRNSRGTGIRSPPPHRAGSAP